MRYTYHLARYQAAATRSLYGRSIPYLAPVSVGASKLNRAVVTFSSSTDLPEQVASLRSLLRHAGEPRGITVVSDGSHNADERQLLRRLHTGVEVVSWDDYAAEGLPERAWQYSSVHPLGKKLIALMSIPDTPTLYADSDVLFFPGAATGVELRDGLTHYLPDLPGGLDQDVIEGARVQAPPANAGCFMTSGALPLQELVAALLPATAGPGHAYVEQALVHLALHRAGARALPPISYALHVHDRFTYRDTSEPTTSVLRHYIGTIRHKFWLAATHASTLVHA